MSTRRGTALDRHFCRSVALQQPAPVPARVSELQVAVLLPAHHGTGFGGIQCSEHGCISQNAAGAQISIHSGFLLPADTRGLLPYIHNPAAQMHSHGCENVGTVPRWKPAW